MPFDGDIKAFLPLVRPTMKSTPRERLDYMIDYLEKLDPLRFDMSTVWSQHEEIYDFPDTESPMPELEADCGSAGCILGWCRVLFGFEKRDAGDQLGMTEDEAAEAFFPNGDAIVCRDPKAAARMLRIYRDEGMVDWDRALKGAA